MAAPLDPNRTAGTFPVSFGVRAFGRKECEVSTATTTRNRSRKPEFKSKSEHMRALYTGGMSVADVCKTVNVGYAFAFGVAKRMPHPDGGTYADRAAGRRKSRAVRVDRETGVVQVVTASGLVTVHPDGTVKRSKIK